MRRNKRAQVIERSQCENSKHPVELTLYTERDWPGTAGAEHEHDDVTPPVLFVSLLFALVARRCETS